MKKDKHEEQAKHWVNTKTPFNLIEQVSKLLRKIEKLEEEINTTKEEKK